MNHNKSSAESAPFKRLIAGGGANSAKVRAATSFALLFVAGELARSFALLPAAAAVGDAVRWAWERFEISSDAVALDPDEQALANVRAWIAERWDVTIKSVDAAADGSDTRRLNNREAVGWYDGDSVYIPTRGVREAAGKVLKEQHIAKLLDRRGLLTRRHNARRLSVQWVPRVGRVQCYALLRDRLEARWPAGAEAPRASARDRDGTRRKPVRKGEQSVSETLFARTEPGDKGYAFAILRRGARGR